MSTRCILTISVLMPLLVLFTAASAPGAWFDSAWQYRKAITINAGQVPATLNNFPLLVKTTDTHLLANAESTGIDICFTADDGSSLLDYEIESYNNGTTGLVAWVRVPSLSSSANTVIYMYYDNPAAVDQSNPTGVWDPNYVMVHHLEETIGNHINSTSITGTNDGIPSVTTQGSATGRINGADGFVATNSNSVDCGDDTSLKITGSMTVEAWAYSENGAATSTRIACKDPQGSVGKFILWKDASGNLEFMVADNSSTWYRVPGNPVADGAWFHVVGVFDAGSQVVRLYKDGFEVDSLTTGGAITLNSTNETFTIGAASNNTHYWNGTIDEVRVSNTAMSADWILTNYNNQNDPGSFYGIGAEEQPCSVDTDCGICEECDVPSGTCVFQPASEDFKDDCSDVDLCLTGNCDGGGACGVQDSGTACTDDGNVCTDDVCDGAGVCLNNNNTVSCDDGSYCNGTDTCSGGFCISSGDPCGDDGQFCNGAESCDEGNDQCVSSGDPCGDDGQFCNGAESCDEGNDQCVSSGDPCAGGDACNSFCNESVNNCFNSGATFCNDNLFCTQTDTCDGNGTCVGSGDPCPDDAVFCNGTESCDEGGNQCVSSGDPCAGGSECNNACQEAASSCFNPSGSACTDDGNVCTDDECNGTGTCVHTNNSDPCDDTIACTENDECSAGSCGGTPNDSLCDDSDVCTSDSCDSVTDCANTLINHTVSLSPDPLDLGSPGEQGVITALVEEISVPVAGEIVTFSESADPNSATELYPMAELDINGEAVVQIHGLQPGTGTINVTAVDMNGDEILGTNYFLGTPLDSGCATLSGQVLTIVAACDTEMTVTCDDGSNSTVGYLIATIDPPSTAVTVEVTPVTDSAGEARLLVRATAEGQSTVSGSVTCGSGAATVNVAECNDDLDCGFCEKCDTINNLCIAQTTSEDTKDECSSLECSTGFCDGAGACEFETLGTACTDDGNVCTDDQCDGTGSCVNTNNTASCDDGNACTTTDTCALGSCVGGPAPNCDDGNLCTDDSCSPASGCVNADNILPCDDSNACTTDDTCSAGSCVGGAAPDCDDGNLCTDDSCNPASGCVNTDNAVTCDDGNACTTSDTCAGGSCVGGAAPNCDDGNLCTDDSCNPASGCVITNNSAPCDDGLFCTVTDQCSGGTCGGSLRDCSAAGDECNDGVCNEASDVCEAQPKTTGTFCDDGFFCNGPDACLNGSCTLHGDDPCELGPECNNQCDEANDNCFNPAGTACDDGLYCTANDQCSSGVCGGSARDCSAAGDECNDGVCNETSDACESQPKTTGTSCDDGLYCNGSDVCVSGSCFHGDDPCFGGPECNNQCDEANDTCFNSAGTLCTDDGNECTDDECDGTGACLHPDNTASCDDSDVCTDDSCNPASGCVNAPIVHTITLSPDPLNLSASGDQGVITALVEENSVPLVGEAVTFVESLDPGNSIELFPMVELDSNGEARVIITGTAFGTGILSVMAVDANGGEITGVTYTLGIPGDTCADLDEVTQTIEIMSLPCITDMVVTCEDGIQAPIAGYLIAAIEPSSPAVTVEVVPVTDTLGEAMVLVGATAEGPAAVSGSVTCGSAADTATVNVGECSNDSECGLCEKCDTINNVCVVQTSAEDEKNECSDLECTTGFCDGAGACGFEPSGTPCTDDGNVCTDDQCDGAGACVNTNNTAPCDDSNACTTGDTCSLGTCGGTALDCNDSDVCTDDSCDPASGCINANNTAPCDDSNACTTGDTCSLGTCGGTALDCNDSDVCTDDSCDTATGCVNAPIVYTITLSPDPLNLSAPGEQGVITALVEENSVPEAGEVVTFVESADPGNATDLYPMAELDINGDAVVAIQGLQGGTGTLSVTAVTASGGVIPGVTYTLFDPLDSGCATLNGNTLTIEPIGSCDTEMTVRCEDSIDDPIVGYLIATIDPVSTAVTVEALPVTNGTGEARLLVEALTEGQATVSGSVTCGVTADTATVNVSACNDDSDCGFCEKCNLGNNTCIFQSASEDSKGECSLGVCSSDFCDGFGACGFLPATTECRPSPGGCDVAENCTGSSAVCPSDGFEPATTVCRPAVDSCDAEETCTGTSATCPSDGFEPATTVCRPAADPCDAEETCTGTSATCPSDGFEPATTVCRPAVDPCDAEETCTGTSATCPADGVAPPTTECRPSVDVCDIAETCTGSSNLCPADAYHIFGIGCRASAGVCDVGEVCTGNSPFCPVDGFVLAGTVCRTSGGDCDIAEVCTGSDPSCPIDVFQPSTLECRPWAGVCDVAENCTGTSATCPIDGSEPNGTSCNDNIYCNGTDTCNSGTCQHAGDPCLGTQCNTCQEALDNCLNPAGTACGDHANTDCTNPDTCNGAGICLSNHASSGSSCSDDGNQCTDDQCNGVGICTHPFLSAGTVCGDQSLTDCTSPDACDGSGFCLANHAPAGIPCTSDGISTTEDICGYSGTCSHFSSSWARVYEGSGRDYARAIYQTFDLGYITAGYTQSFGAGGDDLWVLKLDATGDVNWQKSFGGTETDQAHAVTQTLDGGYIIGGYTRSFGAGGDDLLVLKLGAAGNVLWQKTYGGTGSDRVYSIHETPDGGCIMAAATDSSGAGDYDIWIIKLDSNGDISWHRTYGGSAADEAFAIDQTSDGGYIVAGITSSFGVGGKDAFALKLQNDGDISWFKTYGGSDYDYAYTVTETSEGDYIVAGYSLSFSSNADMWVVKLDSSGGIIWQKRFGGGGLDQAYSVEQTPDGKCVVTGTTLSFGAGARDILLFELDEAGNITWQQTAGGVSDEYVYSINRTFPDDGYSLAGRTTSFGASASGFAVLKFDDTGVAADCDILNSSNLNSANTSGDYRNVSILWTSFIPVVTNVMTSSQNSLADEVVVCGPAVGNRDSDGDGVLDVNDNCPGVANGDQTNSDSDALGNVCDNCPLTNNPLQENSDSDSLGDLCDNCPSSANADQLDSDCDGIGNFCDGSLDCTDGVDCDDDCDGLYNQDDNCPQGSNGPAQGTCLEGYRGQYCLVDAHCGPGGICSQDQDDTAPPQGNGIGDVCDCEGNFDCDSDVDGSDANAFKLDFGRSIFLNPCDQANPCNGNFDCDSDVDGSDAREFKVDFGRSNFFNPCPICVVGPWCY